MNDGPIILVTALVMIGGGVAIFFYWRRTYGVWATRQREQADRPRGVVVDWSNPDGSSATTRGPGASEAAEKPSPGQGGGRSAP